MGKKNDFSRFGDLHALTSGIKALYAWNTHTGLD
jgi:hypothetical protein